MKNDGRRDVRELDRAGRRKSVRKILGVGALAGGGYAAAKWMKPVVEVVALPVHAQTSTPAFCSIVVECTAAVELSVTISGAVDPPVPGVTVHLVIQLYNGSAPAGGDSGSAITGSTGQYSVTKSYGPVVATDIKVTASLPDFPDAGDTVCTLNYKDPGPHQTYSFYYFCSSGRG